ncbi:potassium-transporting ATPase subunit KdpC [Streptomyces sp. E11-3]|uniref:potassium-transporting ATPase subunit KdpC n=1 Tax=Streptomyces sp. E11-3 TaxID=3110112 RepID=UPI00397F483E
MAHSAASNTGRLLLAAFRALLVLTVVTGLAYPLAVTGIAQAAFPDQAGGSLVKADGREVGSTLVGQTFNLKGTDRPDPKWFQPRPSASAYDPLSTGSSQLGASDPTLLKTVAKAKRQVAAFNQVPESEVPKDAVTGSASAIDPHISPEYAAIQVKRVARENGLTVPRVRKLVDAHTGGRTAGFLGEPHVNVLELNIALQRVAAAD